MSHYSYSIFFLTFLIFNSIQPNMVQFNHLIFNAILSIQSCDFSSSWFKIFIQFWTSSVQSSSVYKITFNSLSVDESAKSPGSNFLMSGIRVCATDQGQFFTSKNPEQAPNFEILLQKRPYFFKFYSRTGSFSDNLASNAPAQTSKIPVAFL